MNSPLCIEKGASYEVIQQMIGNGLITLKSSDWRYHRKLLNPSFATHILSQFVPIYNKHAKIMVDRLESMCDGRSIEILTMFKQMSMDLICGERF